MQNTLIGSVAANILGEILWHSVTSDASIEAVSREHLARVLNDAKQFLPEVKAPKFLEVAAYAHITGDLLANEHGWNTTLTDISVETLSLGAAHAKNLGLDTSKTRRIASDFHDLPFHDSTFDIVYISSALHHTLDWKIVLKELIRVTNKGGLFIMQNEPCEREFCFYKFPTNRPESYTLIEQELDKKGLLRTIGEPYTGSRPESLFGMIENQHMQLDGMLEILNAKGLIQSLELDSQIVMSPFDYQIECALKKEDVIAKKIEAKLNKELSDISALMTDTDVALGYSLPSLNDVKEMSANIAKSVCAMPAPNDPKHAIDQANVFGGALTVVLKKNTGSAIRTGSDDLKYRGTDRSEVTMAYPPEVSQILEMSQDLIPDIQDILGQDGIGCFPADNWVFSDQSTPKYFVQIATPAKILPLASSKTGTCLILLRCYAALKDLPYKISLSVGENVIDSYDVHQADSFLLRGEVSVHTGQKLELSLSVASLDGSSLGDMPIITIPSIRIVLVSRN